ncbi:MAG: recombinase family protein [Myxococcales bacterium]|nr:recombinase family protein [Myxococcales bacterium]MBL0197187.1 recombinase family protein [Myxococcales bacterium]
MAQGQREKVIGYTRVSTEGQADGGVSLEAQREKLKAYAIALDLELVEIIEDAGYSAKSLKRPGLQRALEHLAEGRATCLLVTKLDRLTRSVRDLGDLVERYFGTTFSLLSVGDAIDTRTAAGRLVLNVLTSVAQWEREATGERTREALAHLKGEGVRLGPPALGWRRGEERDAAGRLAVVDVDEERVTVARIGELRSQGLSLRGIVARLSEEGRRTKRGGRWQPVTVMRVLRRHAPAAAPPRATTIVVSCR